MKKLIIGNWKMNLGVGDASLYLHKLADMIPAQRTVDVVLAPTILTLQSLSLQVNRRQFKLAAQNCYWRDQGAYTGEVSAAQLKGIADYVLIGHSERRYQFNETDKDIRAKVQAAMRNHLLPVLCVGETALERSNNETIDVLHDQLVGGLANITSDELADLTIAYEPVWAIGTGETASPEQAQEMHEFIRETVRKAFGSDIAEDLTILYGGSVKPDNAKEIFSKPDVDGGLIGGAALNATDFLAIVTAI